MKTDNRLRRVFRKTSLRRAAANTPKNAFSAKNAKKTFDWGLP